MIRLRKYIAFLLFGIFFFSITFQSIHIVWHHSHGYKCEHHLCHSELSDKDSQRKSESISEEEKNCPICEYQFSINDLPKTSFFGSVTPVFTKINNELAAHQQYNKVFLEKTPRAPPVFIS